MREKLKLLYSRNEVFIVPVIKFLLAFITLTVVNGRMGYMSRLDSLPIVLIVSLMCSFLPTGCIILFAALFSLLHMYALSMEVALVGLCLYLIMFLLFFRFSPKDSIVVLVTPLLFSMKIPYVIPIAMGLLGTPASAVSIGCGVIVYYFLNHVITNATAINTLGEEDALAKLKLMIDGLIDNKTMVIMILAFAITVIVVYLLRRMAVDYAWTIAMIAGAIIDLVVLLAGDLIYDTKMSVPGAVLGTIVAVVFAKILEFFRFCVDYSRTEKVQFEDDEYYYYVKAVPKMTVAAQSKTIKKINTQTRQASRTTANARTTGSTRVAGDSRTAGNTGTAGNSRTAGNTRTAGDGRTAGSTRTAGGTRTAGNTRPTGGMGTAGGTRTAAGSSRTSGGGDWVLAQDVSESSGYGHTRNVVTERTAVNRNTTKRTDMTGRANGQKSVAINTNMVEDTEAVDDFEEWE